MKSAFTGSLIVLAMQLVCAAVGADKVEKPAMPANPPANWLTYHLVHPDPAGRAGDPNCAFFWKGRYHLHYIYHSKAGISFAHVSSDDMVHWKWHPTTLEPPFTGHGMFSGTAFLTKDGRLAIIYHGVGSKKNHIAFALDDQLEQWTKPAPVIARDAAGKEVTIRYWDPDGWLNGETYYATSGGKNPSLMKSTDLKSWAYLGGLFHDAYPANLGVAKEEDISCGNMFKIGKKWMLLCISHPLGCRYYLGDFKDEKYLPDFHAMMSFGGNSYFAPESLLAKDGRRVMWAWLLPSLPLAPCGVQSLPRELELPEDGVLRIRPLRELESLRGDLQEEAGLTVKSGAVRPLPFRGDALEIEARFAAPAAAEFGMDVFCDAKGAGGLRISCAPGRKILQVGKAPAPFELKRGEDLVLRVFVDKNLVEVFANDRQAAVAAAPKFDPARLGTALFSTGGDVQVKSIKAWKMHSAYSNR